MEGGDFRDRLTLWLFKSQRWAVASPIPGQQGSESKLTLPSLSHLPTRQTSAGSRSPRGSVSLEHPQEDTCQTGSRVLPPGSPQRVQGWLQLSHSEVSLGEEEGTG